MHSSPEEVRIPYGKLWICQKIPNFFLYGVQGLEVDSKRSGIVGSMDQCGRSIKRVGPLFGARYSNSEIYPGASIGSADLWIDALAALAHSTNDSGATGINQNTL